MVGYGFEISNRSKKINDFASLYKERFMFILVGILDSGQRYVNRVS